MLEQTGKDAAGGATRQLTSICERTWQYRLARQPYLQVRRGLPVTRIAADTLEETEQDARAARSLLNELATVDASVLSHENDLTLQFLRDDLTRGADQIESWWTQFPVTPYAASGLAFYLQFIFRPFAFDEPADVDRYLSLLNDYSGCIRAMQERLAVQAERGWRVPQPALPGVSKALHGLKAVAVTGLPVALERLQRLGTAAATRCQERVVELLRTGVEPAFDELIDYLQRDYARGAPQGVGLSQYPGGDPAYRSLVRQHVAFEIEPERAHAIGLEEVRRLAEEMRSLRSSLGFDGEERPFYEHLRAIGRIHAGDAAQVERRYRYHVERMSAGVSKYFRSIPAAAFDVRRLDAAMEPGLSYGYYEPPTPASPVGLYRYNGSGLETRSQLSAAALIFHELVPGHHFHLARQAENVALPAIRREALGITAFNEGWAEYASGLAGEMGLYDDPYDRYGRLAHERFTAQRLVVDTGLNLFGWSLERARAFMREHTLESDAQIESETLRYSTDLPAQALAYRLGYLKFVELRRRAQQRLDKAFDVRDFHEAVLGPGALPLTLLDSHIDWFIEQRRSGAQG